MEKELRYFASELRVKSDSGKKKITGYSAVFGKLSEDLGGFQERIKKGAFTEALKNSDARGLYNHNPDHVLGREGSGTLRPLSQGVFGMVRGT